MRKMTRRKPAGVRFETWIDRQIRQARERIGAINEKIRDAIRAGIRGPEVQLVPFDVERIVEEWRRSAPPASGNS